MFVNAVNFIKLLKEVANCNDDIEVEKTFNLANRYRESAMITEFEYLSVEKAILEKIGVDITVSRYRGHLNINELLLKKQEFKDE